MPSNRSDALQSLNLGLETLRTLCDETRVSVFEVCLAANNGHIGGASGAVELLVALYFGGILRINPSDAQDSRRDRVLVRGHLGPLRYTIFSLLGYLSMEELKHYRQFGSRLHGHEDHTETPGVDITPSGSLGMLLSYGVGAALAARSAASDYLTYVFIGDGEEQEGNISEAARHAAHLALDNLIAIIDRNGKQLSDPTSECDSANLERMWQGYGWNVINLRDGHDVNAVISAFKTARVAVGHGRPSVIIADTIKGFALDGARSHFSGYHTLSTCSHETVQRAIDSFDTLPKRQAPGGQSARDSISRYRSRSRPQRRSAVGEFSPIELAVTPTSKTPNNPDLCQIDYFPRIGACLAKRGVNKRDLFFLTADVTRHDDVQLLELKNYWTFLNVGIREQHMVAMAHGLSLSRPSSRIIINGLDAFSYRFMDQLNAAAQGKSSIVILGDVAGVTNSRNGKTHQTSGQPGALATMPGVTLLEPWDNVDTFNCLNWAIGQSRGIVYIRLHSSTVSEETSALRTMTQYVVHDCEKPDCVVVASGVTVEHAVRAARQLSHQGISVRIINMVSHQLGQDFVRYIENDRPILTVYNGNARVLLGNVAQCIIQGRGPKPSAALGKGFTFGTTGATDDLLRTFGLDTDGISRSIVGMLNA